MKLVKIIFGTLAGLFAFAQGINLVMLIFRAEHFSALMGAIAFLCIGAALSIALFRSAFAKPKLAKAEVPSGGDS